jgi:hypothetical protein
MDLIKIIAELRKERTALDEALVHLEQFARAQGKRRGRPPSFLATHSTKRKPFSEATKRRMAEAQKRRWAAARKAAKVE